MSRHLQVKINVHIQKQNKQNPTVRHSVTTVERIELAEQTCPIQQLIPLECVPTEYFVPSIKICTKNKIPVEKSLNRVRKKYIMSRENICMSEKLSSEMSLASLLSCASQRENKTCNCHRKSSCKCNKQSSSKCFTCQKKRFIPVEKKVSCRQPCLEHRASVEHVLMREEIPKKSCTPMRKVSHNDFDKQSSSSKYIPSKSTKVFIYY